MSRIDTSPMIRIPAGRARTVACGQPRVLAPGGGEGGGAKAGTAGTLRDPPGDINARAGRYARWPRSVHGWMAPGPYAAPRGVQRETGALRPRPVVRMRAVRARAVCPLEREVSGFRSLLRQFRVPGSEAFALDLPDDLLHARVRLDCGDLLVRFAVKRLARFGWRYAFQARDSLRQERVATPATFASHARGLPIACGHPPVHRFEQLKRLVNVRLACVHVAELLQVPVLLCAQPNLVREVGALEGKGLVAIDRLKGDHTISDRLVNPLRLRCHGNMSPFWVPGIPPGASAGALRRWEEYARSGARLQLPFVGKIRPTHGGTCLHARKRGCQEVCPFPRGHDQLA